MAGLTTLGMRAQCRAASRMLRECVFTCNKTAELCDGKKEARKHAIRADTFLEAANIVENMLSPTISGLSGLVPLPDVLPDEVLDHLRQAHVPNGTMADVGTIYASIRIALYRHSGVPVPDPH